MKWGTANMVDRLENAEYSLGMITLNNRIFPLVAQLDNAADSDSEERGFKSLRAGHMKTPLKSEPLQFGLQWCFVYKPCI